MQTRWTKITLFVLVLMMTLTACSESSTLRVPVPDYKVNPDQYLAYVQGNTYTNSFTANFDINLQFPKEKLIKKFPQHKEIIRMINKICSNISVSGSFGKNNKNHHGYFAGNVRYMNLPIVNFAVKAEPETVYINAKIGEGAPLNYTFHIKNRVKEVQLKKYLDIVADYERQIAEASVKFRHFEGYVTAKNRHHLTLSMAGDDYVILLPTEFEVIKRIVTGCVSELLLEFYQSGDYKKFNISDNEIETMQQEALYALHSHFSLDYQDYYVLFPPSSLEMEDAITKITAEYRLKNQQIKETDFHMILSPFDLQVTVKTKGYKTPKINKKGEELYYFNQIDATLFDFHQLMEESAGGMLLLEQAGEIIQEIDTLEYFEGVDLFEEFKDAME